jgi:hypothetical protein
MSVTPIPGAASLVTTGNNAVTAVAANPNGGFITNPITAADQGIGAAETLYVNAVTAATLAGNGTTFALAPGQTWTIIPGQTTPTSVNAVTSGHKFSVVSW